MQPHMFDDSETIMTHEMERLWDRIHKIYLTAERNHNHRKDESAWIDLVRKMLEISGMGGIEDMVEVDSV